MKSGANSYPTYFERPASTEMTMTMPTMMCLEFWQVSELEFLLSSILYQHAAWCPCIQSNSLSASRLEPTNCFLCWRFFFRKIYHQWNNGTYPSRLTMSPNALLFSLTSPSIGFVVITFPSISFVGSGFCDVKARNKFISSRRINKSTQ